MDAMENNTDQADEKALLVTAGLSVGERQALAETQYQLGRLYEAEGDLPTNRQVARRWYESAADWGYRPAAAALHALSDRSKRRPLATLFGARNRRA